MMLSYLSVIIPDLTTLGRARLAEQTWPRRVARMTLPSLYAMIARGRRAAHTRVERP